MRLTHILKDSAASTKAWIARVRSQGRGKYMIEGTRQLSSGNKVTVEAKRLGHKEYGSKEQAQRVADRYNKRSYKKADGGAVMGRFKI